MVINSTDNRIFKLPMSLRPFNDYYSATKVFKTFIEQISWVRNRNDQAETYSRVYRNLLTWDGYPIILLFWCFSVQLQFTAKSKPSRLKYIIIIYNLKT
jgi:hypothetical protein